MVHQIKKSKLKTGKGIHKYSYDGFSRALNKKREVVAWVGSLTWVEGEKPKIAKGIKEFSISFWIEPSDKDEDAYSEEITIHATDLEALKTALGYYSSYAREWGDYRGIIDALKNKNATIHEVKTKYKEVEY